MIEEIKKALGVGEKKERNNIPLHRGIQISKEGYTLRFLPEKHNCINCNYTILDLILTGGYDAYASVDQDEKLVERGKYNNKDIQNRIKLAKLLKMDIILPRNINTIATNETSSCDNCDLLDQCKDREKKLVDKLVGYMENTKKMACKKCEKKYVIGKESEIIEATCPRCGNQDVEISEHYPTVLLTCGLLHYDRLRNMLREWVRGERKEEDK